MPGKLVIKNQAQADKVIAIIEDPKTPERYRAEGDAALAEWNRKAGGGVQVGQAQMGSSQGLKVEIGQAQMGDVPRGTVTLDPVTPPPELNPNPVQPADIAPAPAPQAVSSGSPRLSQYNNTPEVRGVASEFGNVTPKGPDRFVNTGTSVDFDAKTSARLGQQQEEQQPQGDAYSMAPSQRKKTKSAKPLPNLSQESWLAAPPVVIKGDWLMRQVHLEPSEEYAQALLGNSQTLQDQFNVESDGTGGWREKGSEGRGELMKEGSTLYNRVADRLYQQVYEDAIAEGRGVVRMSQARDWLTPAQQLEMATMARVKPFLQAALKFDEGYAYNVGKLAASSPASWQEPGSQGLFPAETLETLQDTAPEWMQLIGLGGALMPTSAPSRMARAIPAAGKAMFRGLSTGRGFRTSAPTFEEAVGGVDELTARLPPDELTTQMPRRMPMEELTDPLGLSRTVPRQSLTTPARTALEADELTVPRGGPSKDWLARPSRDGMAADELTVSSRRPPMIEDDTAIPLSRRLAPEVDELTAQLPPDELTAPFSRALDMTPRPPGAGAGPGMFDSPFAQHMARLAGSSASGALQGVIGTGLTELTSAPGMEDGSSFDRMMAGGAVGGVLGLGGELWAGRARAGANAIRARKPDLIVPFEQGGAEISVYGPRYPKMVADDVLEYGKQWGEQGRRITPEARMVDRIAPQTAAAGQRLAKEEVSRAGQMNTMYYLSEEGRKKVAATELHDELWKQLFERKGGNLLDADLPALSSASTREVLRNSSDVIVLPPGKEPPLGGRPINDKLARALFGNEWWKGLAKKFDAARAQTPKGMQTEIKAYLVPRELDARDIDLIARQLAKEAKTGKKMVDVDDQGAAQLQRALYQVRDKFEGNDATGGRKWSVVKKEESERFHELQTQLQRSGLRFELDESDAALSADKIAAHRARLLEFNQKIDSKDADDAMMWLAYQASPETKKMLLRLGTVLSKAKLEQVRNLEEGLAIAGAAGRQAPISWWSSAKEGAVRGAYGGLRALEKPLELNDEIRSWIAGKTRGMASLSGGAPARVLTPIEALDVLTTVAAAMEETDSEVKE